MKYILILFATVIFSGCVSEVATMHEPSAPLSLYPRARALKGKPASALYISSNNTINEFLLDSRYLQRLSASASEAVVSIYVATETPSKIRLIPIRFRFTGVPVKIPGIGLGSGFFVHPDGWILTNEHVIRNSTEIQVMLASGKSYPAQVYAKDPAYDLALLKVELPSKNSYLKVGKSEEILKGDQVIAIGNPLGFGGTVSSGIISYKGRSLFEEKTAGMRYVPYIQTDTAINSGSSGGPLISLTGAWIGVNTAKIDKAQGIGFAVPSRLAIEFFKNILNGNGVVIEK